MVPLNLECKSIRIYISMNLLLQHRVRTNNQEHVVIFPSSRLHKSFTYFCSHIKNIRTPLSIPDLVPGRWSLVYDTPNIYSYVWHSGQA